MSFDAQGEWIDDGSTFVSVNPWCPQCDPDGVSEPWVMTYCNLHSLSTCGSADLGVRSDIFLSGTAEAGGYGNRAFCTLIHPRR